MYNQNSNSSSLFHYTGSINSLKSILKDGLKPNYCKEDFSSLNNSIEVIGVPMISFCDIPIGRSNAHRGAYGDYAIGLSKNWALSIGGNINPLFYSTNKSTINFFINNAYWDYFRSKEIIEQDGINVNNYTKSEDSHKKYLNYLNQRMSFIIAYGYTKLYSDLKTSRCNYDENEWRYIDDNIDNWIIGIDNYKQWRGEDDKPISTFPCKNFSATDVNFILLPLDSDIENMIEFIDSIDTLGGNIITNSDKKILYTKITTFERLSQDF